LLEAAATRGWTERCGVDVSAAAVRVASRFGTVRRGMLRDVEFSAASFDVVTFCDSIEHSPDPAADFMEARRLLRPGGWVFVVTPNSRHWTARLLGRRWFQLKPHEHLRLFSEDALRRVLERSGFVPSPAEAATKVITPAFALTILATTNPGLSRVIRGLLPPFLARRPLELQSGDLLVMARLAQA
jgi:2-polyprenyl-3-methyl-5-hydroxy-6-metoxy-1,4-benzoquinol methylase